MKLMCRYINDINKVDKEKTCSYKIKTSGKYNYIVCKYRITVYLQ